MKTIIFFENDKIIIQNASKAGEENSKVLVVPLEEGVIGNGVVFDAEKIVEALRNNKSSITKNAIFVIDSSNVQIKTIEFPLLKDKQIRNLIYDEVSKGTNRGALIASAKIEKKKNKAHATAFAIEKEKLQAYIEIANAAGIKLDKIDTLLNCIIKYTKEKKNIDEETYVMNILKGDTLLSVFFENKNFTFASRNRILAEKDTEGYYRENFEKVTNMVQFAKSQNMVPPLQTIYYSGFDNKTVTAMIEAISEMEFTIEIKTERELDEGKDSVNNNHLNRVLTYALKGAKEDVNLYSEYKDFDRKEKVESGGADRRAFLPVLGVIAITVLIIGAIFTWNAILSADLNDIIAEQNEIIESGEIDFDKMEENNVITARIQSINSAIAARDAENYIENVNLNSIMNLSGDGIVITSIEYQKSDQGITIQGMAGSEDGAAQYTKALRESEMFSLVSYAGYSSGTGAGGYAFTIKGNIAGGE